MGLTVACLGAILAATLLAGPPAADSTKDQTRKAAPGWELKDVDGKLVKSSDFKGKIVILDFWATWCGSCVAEIPGFVKLQKEYAKRDVVIVGVSLDEKGPSVVKPFMKKLGINSPIVMADNKIADAFGGVEGIPSTFIIDSDGLIVSKHEGLTEKSEFEKELKQLLKK